MRGSSRKPVSKGRSASHFRHDVGRSHPMNVKLQPRRGGWRL